MDLKGMYKRMTFQNGTAKEDLLKSTFSVCLENVEIDIPMDDMPYAFRYISPGDLVQRDKKTKLKTLS